MLDYFIQDKSGGLTDRLFNIVIPTVTLPA